MYEIHITCYCAQSEQATLVAKALHWKTSEIARDPVLGNDTYFYLTSHQTTFDQAFNHMTKALNMLVNSGVVIVREKIEHIVHDIRHRSK